jgi:phosphopantetheinyl transferase
MIPEIHMLLSNIYDEPIHSDKWLDDYTSKFIDKTRQQESFLARELLNQLCIQHIGEPLKEIGFEKNENGKPILMKDRLFCSISHSNGWVLVGLSSISFGLDIEKTELENYEYLSSAFSSKEWEQLKNNSLDIFKAFSKKESISKLFGHGFLVEPSEIKLTDDLISWDTVLKTANDQEFIVTAIAKEKCNFSLHVKEPIKE